jgi:hypothetical protein
VQDDAAPIAVMGGAGGSTQAADRQALHRIAQRMQRDPPVPSHHDNRREARSQRLMTVNATIAPIVTTSPWAVDRWMMPYTGVCRAPTAYGTSVSPLNSC